MANYQSFPSESGSSDSLEKLKALRLPELQQKTFLDVGCAEGFFCGFASFSGARQIVGLDISATSVAKARGRFPDCEFVHSDWSNLPDRKFDIVLLTSAIHYAQDQAALIASLMQHVEPAGTLVLELGIVQDDERCEWVEIQRGIDRRFFATWPKLTEILSPYAWKLMGPSVAQSGDPVPRFVVHIQHRRPFVYLLMEAPGWGKSTIARSLFAPAGVRLIKGDELIIALGTGADRRSARITTAISKGFSGLRIDQAIIRLVEQGLIPEYVSLWRDRTDQRDFVYDGYFPPEHRAAVAAALEGQGCIPVELSWKRPGGMMTSRANAERDAASYAQHLRSDRSPPGSFAGCIDEIRRTAEGTRLRGWCVTDSGVAAESFKVAVHRREWSIRQFTRTRRPDVKRHLGLASEMFGFEFMLPAGDLPVGSEKSILLRAVDPGGVASEPLRIGSRAYG